MSKQSFDKVKKTLCILLAVLLLVSLTAASASAWYNKKGEVVAPPETSKNVTAPSAPAPAPVIAPVTSPLGYAGGFGGCCDRFGNCGACGNEKKIAVITAVRVGVAEGEGCFDRVLW